MGWSKNISKRKIYSNTILSQERRKITNKQPNLTYKVTREEEQIKPKVSRRKEIIKIRAEINEIEKKKKIEKTNEKKNCFFEKIYLQSDSSRNKGENSKSIKLEIKKLQWLHKYTKDRKSMINYMPIKWTT